VVSTYAVLAHEKSWQYATQPPPSQGRPPLPKLPIGGLPRPGALQTSEPETRVSG